MGIANLRIQLTTHTNSARTKTQQRSFEPHWHRPSTYTANSIQQHKPQQQQRKAAPTHWPRPILCCAGDAESLLSLLLPCPSLLQTGAGCTRAPTVLPQALGLCGRRMGAGPLAHSGDAESSLSLLLAFPAHPRGRALAAHGHLLPQALGLCGRRMGAGWTVTGWVLALGDGRCG